ncbi:SCO-spondin [Labeo rohita]|uniref:SCO-spondin n=1 Tax=Labeo rohita TaxID=84645 RepID=A0ABQ8LQ45_LABRO|nr:SCO-spondin [Labeo rohita]
MLSQGNRSETSVPNGSDDFGDFQEGRGCSAPSGHPTDQRDSMLSSTGGSTLGKPRPGSFVIDSSLADSADERPLSREGFPGESPALCGVVEPTCVAPSTGAFAAPRKVANTTAEARAPSTRHCYALKCSVFFKWCAVQN